MEEIKKDIVMSDDFGQNIVSADTAVDTGQDAKPDWLKRLDEELLALKKERETNAALAKARGEN